MSKYRKNPVTIEQKEQETVTMRYGALAPSLEQQANEQGLTLGDKAEFLENLRYSKTMLALHVLTDSESRKVTKRIHERVMQELKPKSDEENSLVCEKMKSMKNHAEVKPKEKEEIEKEIEDGNKR